MTTWFFAGAGNDLIIGGSGEGDDTLNGGSGVDTVSFASATLGITVDLPNNIAFGDPAIGTDSLDLIENVIAGAGADLVIGDDVNNVLDGGPGADTLQGGGGEDNLIGSEGADSLFGEDDNDVLDGGADNDLLSGDGGDDELNGGAGDDNLVGGAGGDALDGGDGRDIANYLSATVGVDVQLAAGTADDGSGTDTLQNVEDVFGSLFGDLLAGNGDSNILFGFSGSDNLEGGAGDDALFGGTDSDTLAGGDDNDNLDGGAGNDIASFQGETAAVNANLADGTAVGASSGTDTLADIENLAGTEFDDTLAGDDNANSLIGFQGDDLLTGAGGDDTLAGGTGQDTALFSGNLDDYDVTIGEDGSVTVTDTNLADGDDGEDLVDGVETLQFADGAIFLDGNNAPRAFDDGAVATANTPLIINVTANDEDFDGDNLGITNFDNISDAGGSVVQNANGTLTYTPPVDFTGSDQFTYFANDGVANSSVATVTIDVQAPVTGPLATGNFNYSPSAPAVFGPEFVPAPDTPLFPVNVDTGVLPDFDPNNPNGVNPANLTIQAGQTAQLTFQHEDASFRSVLGWYEIGANGEIIDPSVIFANTSAVNSRGDLVPGETTFDLGSGALVDPESAGQIFDTDTQIGFFLIANGFAVDSEIFRDPGLDAGHFEFGSDGQATIFDSDPELVFFADDGTESVVTVTAPIFHTAATPENENAALNSDGIFHVFSGLGGEDAADRIGLTTIGADELVIAFEDLSNGGDRDFNDVIVSLDVGPGLISDEVIGQFDISIGIGSGDSSIVSAAAVLESPDAGDGLVLDQDFIAVEAAPNLFNLIDSTNEEDTGIQVTGLGTSALTFTGEGDSSLYENILDSLRIVDSNGTDIEEPAFAGAAGPRTLTLQVEDEDGLPSPDLAIAFDSEQDAGGTAVITGTDGADILVGSAADDAIAGGNGNDVLRGAAGNDLLDGGAGANTYLYVSPNDGFAVLDNIAAAPDSGDAILGFDGDDVLQFLAGSFFSANTEFVGDVNFFAIDEAYDGTNSGAAAGSGPILIHDTANGVVSFDAAPGPEPGAEGYTLVAQVGVGTAINEDNLDNLGGPT